MSSPRRDTSGIQASEADPEGAVPKRPLLRRLIGTLGALRTSSAPGVRQAGSVLELCDTLLSERGEVSVALAAQTLQAYSRLDAAGRDVFFDLVAHRFLPDPEYVLRAADAYRRDPTPKSLSRLQIAVESPRQELFRRLNLAPGGIATLIEMRRQLLETLDAHPERSSIDADLAHLFRSWFNGGFLELRRIDWTTAAAVLERLIQYEAVHEITGWDDLRRRLEADRRCYAFFHPALPDDPLIFIEVALTRGMSHDVQPLLDPKSPVFDPAKANSAIFYSITNCQTGLRGISFGNLLIKKVVEDLRRSFPRLRTFATLSPVPGFRAWLTGTLRVQPRPGLPPDVVRFFQNTKDDAPAAAGFPAATRTTVLALCAYYLLYAKRDRAPLDPVARFHLANGAQLARLNWLGDSSVAGMRRSLGLMVNYTYDLSALERNIKAYAKDRRVTASRSIERLARQSGLPVGSDRAARSRDKSEAGG